jgi:pimeloyl-ACP methyl ester carboxylesterase
MPDRPGYPPNPPIELADFEEDAKLIAELIQENTHLVGFSYGGVISLFAASLCPEKTLSLTVIEPPAFGIARGLDDVDGFISKLEAHWANSPRDPRIFLMGFLDLVAGHPVDPFPDPLPPELEQGVKTLICERFPWDADPPLSVLRHTAFPKLVISGGHHPAFEAVCDVLERELHADRSVLSGNGHGIPGLGAVLNERLKEFIASV